MSCEPLKMQAALRLVLFWHNGRQWDSSASAEWRRLCMSAGIDEDIPATTRGLCNVVRSVLGEEVQQ